MSLFKKGQLLGVCAIAAMALVGCGGSDSSIDVGPTAQVTGRTEIRSGLALQSVTSPDGEARLVSVSTSGGNIPGLLPGGISVNAGQAVTAIDSRSRPLGLLQPAPEEIQSGLTRASGAAPGTIFISNNPNAAGDGSNSGMRLSNDGTIVGNNGGEGSGTIVLPVGSYKLTIRGPLKLGQGNNKLTIKEGVVAFFSVVTVNGQTLAAFPEAIDGQIPANGGSTLGLSLKSDLPNQFAGYSQRLTIVHANGTLDQQRTSNGVGAVVFSDAVLGSSSSIPRNGVQTVTYRSSATPTP
jgi:hypothetical protein